MCHGTQGCWGGWAEVLVLLGIPASTFPAVVEILNGFTF